jgi:hypothetical protein
LAALHLIGVGLFPGGTNPVFGWQTESAFSYLTYFARPDAFGLPGPGERENFLVYKIFAQDGTTLEGIFPDSRVRPRLRYERWASAGNLAATDVPELHAAIMSFVVDKLPEPPLRVELFSAHWTWDRNAFKNPWHKFNPGQSLQKRMLGTFNGLTRTWTPTPRGARE